MTRPLLTLVLVAASLAVAQEAEATPPPVPLEAPVAKQSPVPPPAPVVETKPTPPPPTALEVRGGTVGVGYLGLAAMTPASFAGLGGVGGGLGGLGTFTLRTQVPLLGVRWWLKSSRVALDLGAGMMGSTSSELTQVAVVPPSVSMVAHVGLPVAITSTQHVIVLVAPEFRAGFSTTTQGGGVSTTSSLLELGVRGAVELFFGFIGVPALSLEAAVRVGVAREAQGFNLNSPLVPGGSSSLTSESFRFSTSLSGDAASIVASTLALRYYF
jgi:hypothetical protein